MEPKPVLSFFGDDVILGTVLKKKVQARFRQTQVLSLSKEDPSYSTFSSLCEGFEFIHFPNALDILKGDYPFYQRPALHTFWCGYFDSSQYNNRGRPYIKQWLDNIRQMGGGCGGYTPASSLIIYCVTAEVRARKQRPMLHVGGNSVEERVKADFKNLADEIIVFRLASSDESRLLESSQALVAKLNAMALAKFNRDIDKEKEAISRQILLRCEPELFYKDRFVRMLDLAVAYEMTVQNHAALMLYSQATADLEDALTQFTNAATPPKWLEAICNAPCLTWDYPKLVWTQLSWRYLADVRACTSPLLHTRTFLLVRVAHLMFVLEKAWSVTELVISTLHCMAREIKMLKLSFPAGAFHCWAYMSCNEAIQAFMARISADSLMAATSSLLIVRAELWDYALQKLHDVGLLSGLMPSSNKLNHDKVLVQQISSGITPVHSSYIDSGEAGMEDLGKKLQNILNDRMSFQTEYLKLGETVIGVFKHAGRRRMAFRVGTKIAQFHRDMGHMLEAEELLSDVCKLYSKDKWAGLSTKAYSLLAECQMRLRQEEKQVNTMLLLASFPPYPAASHDPSPWMDKIVRIAQHSVYQKLLGWEPLLELMGLEGGRTSCMGGELLELVLVIRLHAPKEMKGLLVTVQSQLLGTSHSHASNSSPSLLTNTPLPHRKGFSSSPANSLLDDLDLESDTVILSCSRQIGESSKYRSTNQMTHISHNAIAEIEANWHPDEGGKVLLIFTAVGVTLSPGLNRVRVHGKVAKAGEYVPHKASVKFGALNFACTMTDDEAVGHSFLVQEPQMQIDIALTSQLGVFLAGWTQHCVLSFMPNGSTSIPDQASVCLTTTSSISMLLQSPPTSPPLLSPPSPVQGDDNMAHALDRHFSLPSISAGQSHDTNVILSLPAKKSVFETVGGGGGGDGGEERHGSLVAWKHEMEVYCNWLTPTHVAALSMEVYEPLSLSCLEHSSGGFAFLQLFLANTCPLPLLIRHPSLNAPGLDLNGLHGNLPMVFYPQDSYSFLWQVKTSGPYSDEISKRTAGSFEIEFSPLPMDFDLDECELPDNPDYSTLHYNLMLSNMHNVFEVQVSVESNTDHTGLIQHRSASLICTITNTTPPPPHKTQFPSLEEVMPTPYQTSTASYKLCYEVCVNKKLWKMQDNGQAFFEMPRPQRTVRISFQVVPCVSGVIELPFLRLHRVDMGQSGPEERTPLTSAQVYNLSHGQMVTVINANNSSVSR